MKQNKIHDIVDSNSTLGFAIVESKTKYGINLNWVVSSNITL